MSPFLWDLLMVTLLSAAIIFCWSLNKRLYRARQIGAELNPSVRTLSTHIMQLSEHLDHIKETAKSEHKGLKDQILTSITLKDDLDVLIEHCEKIAIRLDQAIEKATESEKKLQQVAASVSNRQSFAATENRREYHSSRETDHQSSRSSYGFNGGLLKIQQEKEDINSYRNYPLKSPSNLPNIASNMDEQTHTMSFK